MHNLEELAILGSQNQSLSDSNVLIIVKLLLSYFKFLLVWYVLHHKISNYGCYVQTADLLLQHKKNRCTYYIIKYQVMHY